MRPHTILFFADRLSPLIGGMEIHGDNFIRHFSNHSRFPIARIITQPKTPIETTSRFFFFNSGRWIEELQELRQTFPSAIFIYRTGGNEILKASLVDQKIASYQKRLSYWINTLNSTLDLLITNSAYTENRLRKAGLTCRFLRCVGGVNPAAFQNFDPLPSQPQIFCAARFVPYKNHALMVAVLRCLEKRGYDFQVRLAGDGPLLASIRDLVQQEALSEKIHFLGNLSHQRVCEEMCRAHLYLQLSCDHVTEVEGGSYLHSEGMGRSILEALTAGTFIIAGQSGALAEVVTKNRGILTSLDSPERIADQIEPHLKMLPPRSPILEDYSWENVFKKYETFMEQNVASCH